MKIFDNFFHIRPSLKNTGLPWPELQYLKGISSLPINFFFFQISFQAYFNEKQLAKNIKLKYV